MKCVSSIALWFVVALVVDCKPGAASTSMWAVSPETGIGLSVGEDGSFGITTRIPGWTFSGTVGSPLADLTSRLGRDRAGKYREVEFKYERSDGAARLGAIRVYDHRPAVVFKLTFLTAGRTSEGFPSISSYPQNLHHLAYTSVFGGYSFERFGTDGPWVLFDDHANTFILSPASHYMNASLSLGPQNEMRSAIIADDHAIPAGFV